MKMKWLKFTKAELLIVAVISISLTSLMVYILINLPIGLVDPKPKLPPQEVDRIRHPKGFSIIAPKGWQSFVVTSDNNNIDRITIQPDIDARWYPHLVARLFSEDDNPYYTSDPNRYQSDSYLEFDARVYEGLCADYHGWHAVFSYEGKRYGVLLMLPHGHGSPRYNKVPDYWWSFLNTFRIDPKPRVEIVKDGNSNLFWGERVNGLRAAVEFIPEKECYNFGEVIGIQYKVQNVSERIIQLSTTTWRFGAESKCVIKDKGGKSIPVSGTFFTGRSKVDRYEILPGEAVVLKSSSLAIAKDWAQAKGFRHPIAYSAVLKPGEYSLRYELRFPDIKIKDADGNVTVPLPDDWQGTLITGSQILCLTDSQPP